MCNVDFDACSGLMGQLARDIRRNANCGDDYADGNPLVVQAYNGMQAYAPLYEAGCHKSSSGSYCTYESIRRTWSVQRFVLRHSRVADACTVVFL